MVGIRGRDLEVLSFSGFAADIMVNSGEGGLSGVVWNLDKNFLIMSAGGKFLKRLRGSSCASGPGPFSSVSRLVSSPRRRLCARARLFLRGTQ